MIDVSVITATWKRTQLLGLCCRQFANQRTRLHAEHIVISDGPDKHARNIALYYGARYFELPENKGDFGASCNDKGITVALGKYVVFWNDDNLYYDFALDTLYQTAKGFDIGVCRVLHWGDEERVIIPRKFEGTFQPSQIDAMNICVYRELASVEKWEIDKEAYDVDFQWLRKLSNRGITTNYTPVVIGEHL